MPGHVATAILTCLMGAITLFGASASAESGKARAIASEGQRLFKRGQYRAAVEAFERAYQLKPHYLIQCNIARCYEMTGDLQEARERYRRCLDEGADKFPNASRVRAALAQVERRIAQQDREKSGSAGGPARPGDKPGSSGRPAHPEGAPGSARIPERPFYAQFAAGAALELSKVSTQFKLGAEFGYHFMGTTTGPGLALDLQVGVGSNFTSIELGPRFVWDLLIVPSIGLYLSPTALVGYAHFTENCFADQQGRWVCASARNGLTMQVGIGLKVLVARRVLLMFRPVSLDVFVTRSGYTDARLRWDMFLGAGAVF
jgi:hypothetical protein